MSGLGSTFVKKVEEIVTASSQRPGNELELTLNWEENADKNGGYPEMIFYSLPPVQQTTVSNRILLFGTNMVKLEKALPFIPEAQEGSPQIVKCSHAGSFWEAFFGERGYLDKEVTIPKLIVTTGLCRNYNRNGGETLQVDQKIEEFARKWNVPIQYIEP